MTHKINPEIKTQWVAALRSGKYGQTTGTLRRASEGTGPDGFCCLGVLCDIMAPDGWRTEDDEIKHSGLYGYPDHKLRGLAGFAPAHDVQGRYRIPQVEINGQTLSLDSHNDAGVTFEHIAKAIEEQL